MAKNNWTIVKDNDWINKLYRDYDEKEFSYYQNCFTWAFRNGEWRKIPSNTLAEGDIIKLLPGDTTPALVKLIRDFKNIPERNLNLKSNERSDG